MQLAKVVGSLVSTQKSSSLTGKKLLLIQAVKADGLTPSQPNGALEVAVDSVGAGDGELVLVTRGSSARMVLSDPHSAADLCIVAIVDSIACAPCAERGQSPTAEGNE